MEDEFMQITSALYRILDCLPENDPLKNRAKEKALAILENLTLVSGAEGWVSLQKEKASAQLLDDIQILENYLMIGKQQGWISPANFLIITKEYHKIKSTIRPPEGMVKRAIGIAKGVVSDEVKLIDKKSVEDNFKPLEYQESFTSRQYKILKILSEREKAQVSDLIKELPKITKRTVRRDLDDLLKRGKIVRIGEWNQVFYKSNFSA